MINVCIITDTYLLIEYECSSVLLWKYGKTINLIVLIFANQELWVIQFSIQTAAK